MPQPNKKRGRRMEGRKRKHEDGEEEDSEIVESSKRRKSTEADHEQEMMPTDGHDDALDGAYPPMEKAFFGMLDDEEQEYFKRADDMLEANTFAEAEERSLFLANVYREADGKELKLAQSQSCSRLMERLIQLSSPDQLKTLFQKFSGKYVAKHDFCYSLCSYLTFSQLHTSNHASLRLSLLRGPLHSCRTRRDRRVGGTGIKASRRCSSK